MAAAWHWPPSELMALTPREALAWHDELRRRAEDG
ncbi:hypothetical protein [Neoroseomonas terrae]